MQSVKWRYIVKKVDTFSLLKMIRGFFLQIGRVTHCKLSGYFSQNENIMFGKFTFFRPDVRSRIKIIEGLSLSKIASYYYILLT